ncbi:hypothetical protein [Ensifer aridi]|uniref:hypothetical protein n=1 Tax=Ensifer aridi TaxID=1708715 RepID=UPI0004059C12|nr:hypothetical protein [Ensifer aridi]
MVRTMIGVDSTGAGCIKIMKNNADDPRTTPDSQRSKFLYNSKFALQASVADIEICNVITSSGSVVYRYFPAGSNASNYTSMEGSGGGDSTWLYKNAHFANLKYDVPLFDWKAKSNTTQRYNQAIVQRRFSGQYYHDQGGYYFTGNQRQGAWLQGYNGNISQWGSFAFGTYADITTSTLNDQFNRFLSRDKRLIVWNLPGNSEAPKDAPPLAPNGQKAIRIASNAMLIARPGYNVDTADYWQIAYDSRRLPVKVIAAADIALPGGITDYDTGVALPDTVAADVHFYTGSTIMYPNNPVDLDFGAEYWFEGSRIRFSGGGNGMRARFMIYLEDNSAPSGGSNKVLRQFNDGTRDVVQFLRPGSADPPSWADIIIDTRWPAVQILAEGYFAVAAGNNVQTTINFDANGMFPMVKYITEHGSGSRSNLGSWQKSFKMPYVKRLVYSYQGRPDAGDSTYCALTNTSATFHTFRGNVGDYYNDAGDPGTWKTTGVGDPPLGIRYYIFGIPA